MAAQISVRWPKLLLDTISAFKGRGLMISGCRPYEDSFYIFSLLEIRGHYNNCLSIFYVTAQYLKLKLGAILCSDVCACVCVCSNRGGLCVARAEAAYRGTTVQQQGGGALHESGQKLHACRATVPQGPRAGATYRKQVLRGIQSRRSTVAAHRVIFFFFQ